MSRPVRRHGRRLTALVLVLLVGATSLVAAPSVPAAPAVPQTGPSGEQPTIEAARLDLDAVPADETASALPDQVHSDAPEPDATTPDASDIPSAETPTTEAPVAESPECLCPGWTRQAALPLEGEMINIIWEGEPGLAVQVRSHGPDGWSEWADAHLDADESPDAGTEGVDDDRHVIGPVWTGPGTDQVEVYLEAGSPRSLELEVLHSVVPEGWDPGAPQPAPTTSIGAPAVSSPSATQPVIFNRGQWGAGPWRHDNPGCNGGPFYAKELRFGVVHHTVSTNSYTPGQAFSLVQGVYYTHTNSNGWCDIGYNFLVDKYGQIFEGRSMSLYGPVTGGHAKGFNSGSVGIALLGQYHPGSSPPAAGVTGSQLASVAQTLAWKFDFYGIDPYGQTLEVSGGSTSIPAGQWVWLNNVSGHRDVGATACPGNNMYNLFSSLRASVKSRQVPSRFRDVPPAHTFYDDIEWMAANGLARGWPDRTYRPGYWVLRQETMVILHRFAASPNGPFLNPRYPDVPTNHFAYKAIAWAASRDLAGAYPDGNFKPTLWVSREAMVVFLYRLSLSPPGPFPDPGLRDVKSNHPNYKAIAWAVQNKVVTGYPDGTFRGDEPVNRGFTAAFMRRYARLY